ncbi:MAG: hypothetical protein HY937_06030 [Nitrosomonadales bacterium]|nr:hypothetical protein [Nitrosomonadales bacterium]
MLHSAEHALRMRHHDIETPNSAHSLPIIARNLLTSASSLATLALSAAISAHRPYRPGFGLEIALAEITKQRGIYYDPQAVDACLCVIKEKCFVFAR